MIGADKPALLAAGRMFVVGILLGLATPAAVFAHKGPPFPILMDKPAAGQIVSVWADPDIGEATFFIIVESPTGGPPRQAPSVSMWAEPVSGRLDRITYNAEQDTLKNQLQFIAKPYFDQRDMWNVGFQIATSDGKSDVLTTEIESTPPGFGPWDLAIYLFPFLLLAGMWVLAMIRRRRMKHPHGENRESLSQESHGDQECVASKLEDGI